MSTPYQKFFLYARKSTDVEDKQVRSIEDQLTELRVYAKNENLSIIEELVEKQSAKIPGRPIFNDMISRLEQGDAQGILAWHPDRLARNSVDGGRIIYLLDCGRLLALKFPTFWFEPTPQGKFMLNIAFGQSKYYVDSLAENTKRGLRQKVRRGEFPSLAPFGYINDMRTKTVVPHKQQAPLIRQAFELYAKNESRLEDISNFLAQQGIHSRLGKRLHRDRISFILSNPFYYGHFRYGGELHEGIHEPVVSKKIFDQTQAVLKSRGKPHHKPKNSPSPFCGLISCAACGMMITGEHKIKRQKNGNVHEYVYYRCTRKHKTIKCTEPWVRQEELDRQLSRIIQKFSLRKDWAQKLRDMMHKDEKEGAQSSAAFVQEVQARIKSLTLKLQRLLDGYLDQDIDRETYRERKAELLSEKKSLEENVSSLEQKRTAWLEPMRAWVSEAENLPTIAQESNLLQKKVAAKEIFGSNLRLAARQVFCRGKEKGEVEAQNVWAALGAANQSASKMSESLILVAGAGIAPAVSWLCILLRFSP